MGFRIKTFLATLAAALTSVGAVVLAVRGGEGGNLPLVAVLAGLLGALLAAAAASTFLTREVRRNLREARHDGGTAAPPFDEIEGLLHTADLRVSEIEAESEQFKAVVEGMSEGILVTEADGQVAFANPQWLRFFGSAGTENASVLELGREPILDRLLATTLESGQKQRVELELRQPVRRTLVLTSAPLLETGGAVVVAQDMTEFLRLTEIRRDFVANVSHELKTPLSAIRGFAETLVDGAKDDPKASGEFLVRILRQCDRLEALLSDLLTLSKLEHDESKLRTAPVDLRGIVGEAIEVVSEAALAKDLTLDFSDAGALEIEGDAIALERLCVNLLDNAVKYNRAGGRVWIRLFGGSSEGVLEVEDTGIGIPASSLDRLFERFYRVDKGRAREEGGTGLGLAIVKHSTHLHGGSIEVESELGKGSLFRVRLPKGRPQGSVR